MSIPKEPRQLMINLMYLVLTALLALNVSAEVLQAFISMDKSLLQSSEVVQSTNQRMVRAIDQHASAYAKLQPYKAKVDEVQQLSGNFYQLVQSIKEEVIVAGGGLDEHQQPKDLRNKEIATRILVDEGNGEKLKNQFLTTRSALLELIEDPKERQQWEQKLPIGIQPLPPDAATNSWSEFTFRQLPLAAALPMLTKLQSDMQLAETTLLNYFFESMNVEDKVDAFYPVITTNKSYVIKGEPVKGEIFLASYSSTSDNLRIELDNRPMTVENGKAGFEFRPQGLGQKDHQCTIFLTNPLTGEEQQFSSSFQYEVGERSVAVSADKMNVLYLGVDNPISISAAGIPSSRVQVKGTNVTLSANGNHQYVAKPTALGKAVIEVSGPGLPPTKHEFRVKRIPNPVLKMGTKSGGTMTAAEMQVQPGIIPDLEDFEFDAKCRIIDFDMARVPKDGDAIVVSNEGNAFSQRPKNIIRQARRNDTYYFTNVRVKCPGDDRTRDLGGLVFTIR